MIAFLGTGLLGSNFTRALLQKGHQVQVWNRTPARARALEAHGARAFDDAAEAVRGAERVHLAVSDDAAVDAVLAAARLPGGALVIDHTTTSTAGALERSARPGLTYVHAPVFMGPQNALESTGLMLLSGPRRERVYPLVAPMTGKVVDLGPRVDAAAAFKLMGNTFLMGFTAAIGDLLGLGKALGFTPQEASSLLEHFNPGTSTLARAQRMVAARYEQPSWELAMARKDARLVQAEVDRAGLELLLVPAIARRMDQLLAEGHGHHDWTVLARDFVGR